MAPAFGQLSRATAGVAAAGAIWGVLAASGVDASPSLGLLLFVAGAHAVVCSVVGGVVMGSYLISRRLGVHRWLADRRAPIVAGVAATAGVLLGASAAGLVYAAGIEVRALPWATLLSVLLALCGGAVFWSGLEWLRRRRGSRAATIATAGVYASVLLSLLGGAASAPRGDAPSAMLEGGGLAGRAVTLMRTWYDGDQDNYPVAFCGEDCDCDDHARTINPGADEIPDNGTDEDCDGADLETPDLTALMRPRAAPTRRSPRRPTPPRPTTEAPAAPTEGSRKWQRRHNVLLIVMDTVRADHLHFMGYERETSPRLDALASRSVVFTQARVQGSMTRESLAPIFAGMFFEEMHRRDQEWPLFHSENVMLAERFKAAGYSTFGISSFIYVVAHFGFAQGFDTFEERILEERAKVHWKRTSDLVTDYTLAAVDRMSATRDRRPWFVFAHYADPHAGYLRHEESPRFGGFTADIYDEEIYFTDLHIGRLLDGLRARGLHDDTVVLVTSDHGENLRRDEDHGNLYHGHDLYDTLVHVPLIIHVPGVAAREVDEPVAAIDIAPTVMELTGMPPARLSGRSLVPIIVDTKDRAPRGPVFMAKYRPRNRQKVAMVQWPHKIVWNIGVNRWELYDLAQDPGEKRNLARAQEATLAPLRNTLKAWRSLVLQRRPSRD